jgi:FkbM family methyltransferase
MSLGRDVEALASYERAIALHPGFASAIKSRAYLLRCLHRPEEALVASEQAIAALPNEADSYINRSLVLSELAYDQPNLVLDHLERYAPQHTEGGPANVHATALDREEYARFFAHCVANRAWTAAQSFQDLFVRYTLRKPRGFFVEFGAADGVLTSNTWALERDFAWAGILAEPARTWHNSLKANRRCAIDTRCVWSRSGEQLVFNETAMPLLSTIATFSEADDHAKRRKDGTRYVVETVSLNDLLAQHGAPKTIDYMSVDTEGSECEILESLDFARYEIGVLTVEHNFHWGNRNRLYAFLTAKGYVRRLEALLLQDDWYVKT